VIRDLHNDEPKSMPCTADMLLSRFDGVCSQVDRGMNKRRMPLSFHIKWSRPTPGQTPPADAARCPPLTLPETHSRADSLASPGVGGGELDHCGLLISGTSPPSSLFSIFDARGGTRGRTREVTLGSLRAFGVTL